jgi:hypothetical protein
VRTFALLGMFAVGIACGSAGAFVCDSDAECDFGGAGGVCQPGGYCSFPDAECSSGQRYGEHAAVGLAGQCVPTADPSDGSAGETSGASASGTDGDPSLDDGVPDDGTTSSSDPDTSGGPVAVDDGSTGEPSETTGGPDPLDPDLVLWLTFDDPRDPLADASTYAREVVCGTDADTCPEVLAGGPMQLGAEFDGTDDILSVPHVAELETAEGLTVVASVRNDALSTLSIRTVIARPYDVLTENAWEIFFRDETGDGMNDVVFEIADPSGQIQLVATPTVAKSEWLRIAAVWTVDSVSLYFDGVAQATAPATGMLLDDSAIHVGGDLDNLLPTHYFVGAIDDVRVYRRALTDDEIAALP